MFFFLSKLLPLFIYPLGLTCVLLLVALGLLWKRPRLAALPILASLLVLGLGSSGWMSDRLVRSLEFQLLPVAPLPKADAIVVLGGATEPPLPPRPWVELREEGDRVVYAAKLYREGKAPLVILSGGRVQWDVKAPPESTDMAEVMEPMGVPRTAMLEDPASFNTYENAVNVKKIMQAQGIRQILLVTSAMHMPRSLLIFKRLGIEAIPAPTDFLTIRDDIPEVQSTAAGIILNTLPEAEHLRQTTRALKEYIGIMIYRLRGWA